MKIFNFPFLICTKEIQQKNQTGTENDFFEKKLFMGKQTHPTGAKGPVIIYRLGGGRSI